MMLVLPLVFLALLVLAVLICSFVRRARFEFRTQLLELLATATRRQLPLLPMLERAGEEQRGSRRRILAALVEALRDGLDLGEALAESAPKHFPEHVLQAIRAADGSAELPAILSAQVHGSEDALATHHRLSLALFYPLVLSLVLLLVHALWLQFIGYSFLAPTTEGMSGWLSALVWSLAIVPAFLLVLQLFKAKYALLRHIDAFLGWLFPFVARNRRLLAAARLLPTMATLVRLGLPLAGAMRRSAPAGGDASLCQSLRGAADSLEAGNDTMDAWQASGLPETVTSRLAATAGSGQEQLAATLFQAAESCRLRYLAAHQKALAWLHPMAVTFFGVLVAVYGTYFISYSARVREAVELW